jgi:hypothetical protein
MVDRHKLKSSVSSRYLFLLFIVLAEKPVQKRRSDSIAFFVMMAYSCRRDNENQAVSIDECFRFGLLSFLISVSSSFSATVNSVDSDALNDRGWYLSPSPRRIHQVTQQ